MFWLNVTNTRIFFFSITEIRGTIKKNLETTNKFTRVAIDESFVGVLFNLEIDCKKCSMEVRKSNSDNNIAKYNFEID